jgi:hypothetical protein
MRPWGPYDTGAGTATHPAVPSRGACISHPAALRVSSGAQTPSSVHPKGLPVAGSLSHHTRRLLTGIG